MRKLIVTQKFDNKKVSDILYSSFNGLTKNTLYKAFRKKDIRINNIKISEDKIVHLGDEIAIYVVDDFLFKDVKIEKIYEDENILVVNKPINIEVTGDNSLTQILSKEYFWADAACKAPARTRENKILFMLESYNDKNW